MRDGEPGDPTLVFNAKLSQTIDARLSEVDRAKPVNPGVVYCILVRRAFRATVGRMKVKRLRFRNSIWAVRQCVMRRCLSNLQASQLAIDLVGGSVEEDRFGKILAQSFQNVEGAKRVDFKIVPRILQ